MSEPGYFETSFGDRIELIPEYRSLYPDATTRIRELAAYYRQVDEIRGEEGAVEGNTPLTFKGFVSRYLGVLSVVEFLEGLQIDRRFERLLDIGTGFAVQPMIMRGLGIAARAEGVDWINRSTPGTDRMIAKHFGRARNWRFLEPLVTGAANVGFLDQSLKYGLRKFGHPRAWGHETGGFLPSKESFYGRRMVGPAVLDDYLVEDFFGLKGQYDLITGFAAILLFPAEELFQKVSDLLSDDGIFVWNDPYYWYPVPPSFLIGKFPYTFQRLTPEDFTRYIGEHHADEADDMQRVYDYVPQPAPSVGSYLALARKYDLVPVGIKRVQFGNDFPLGRGAGPSLLAKYANTNLHDVVTNIGRFRDDVGPEDLITGRLIMGLRRRRRDESRLDMRAIEKELAVGFPSKPPAGPVFDKAKKIAEKVMRAN